METWQIVLLGAAVALGVWNLVRLAGVGSELKRLSFGVDSLQHTASSLREELGRELLATRGHLARVSAGERLEREMILDGRPFAQIGGEQAQRLLEQQPGLVLLDVRTGAEYERGHIPGARLLPVDQLERRLRDLPQDKGTPLIAYCQSGGRSAAACEVLSSLGYTTLYNLAGGIGAWRGPVEQGSPLAPAGS